MGTLPIRWRLTLAFAAAMLLALVAAGVFLRVMIARDLDDGVDEALRRQLAAISDQRAPTSPLRSEDEVGQVLAADGTVLASWPKLPALLDAGERTAVGAAQVRIGRAHLAPLDGRVALVARRRATDGAIVVAGRSLEDRDDLLALVTRLLVGGGLLAALIAGATGWLVARRALAPVAAMRREADRISGGRPLGRLALPPARDELHDLATTLNAMLARLANAIERERSLVADASHELRTPIAILLGEIELALEQGQSIDDLRTSLISAREEATRLARIAEDLLTLARAEEGALQLHRERLDVDGVFEGVARRFARRAADAGRAIRVASPSGLAVCADRLRLDQALDNLTDNALRYGAGEIVLAASGSDGMIELTVEDGGAGFAEDLRGRAFERFARGPAARSTDGSGLGLALVRAIARGHGGDAEIGPRPAQVRLLLPGV